MNDSFISLYLLCFLLTTYHSIYLLFNFDILQYISLKINENCIETSYKKNITKTLINRYNDLY